jgi:hypothetical protein
LPVEIVGAAGQCLGQVSFFFFDQNLKQSTNIAKNGILENLTVIHLLGGNVTHLESP